MKSFENVFLVPFPKAAVDITVTLRDYHEQVNATMTHSVDPKDILIRKTGEELATLYYAPEGIRHHAASMWPMWLKGISSMRWAPSSKTAR